MKLLKSPFAITVIVLASVSALAYLPFIGQFGYFNDDWYLMYAAGARGASVFHDIYAIDRPARGYLMAAAFTLFGQNVLYYHLSAYLFRLLSGLAFYWTLTLLWPRQKSVSALSALLFLIYPGFLSQFNPIDYQSQQVSLFVAQLSLALTALAVLEKRLWAKSALVAASVLTGWTYAPLVEYFFGLEAFRLGIVLLLSLREAEKSLWQRIRLGLWCYLPFALAPAGFMYWRLFLFESERKATDVGVQIAQLIASPLTTLLGWGTTLVQDTVKVVFLAWGVPLYNRFGVTLRLREVFLGAVIAVLVVLVTAWMSRRLENGEAGSGSETWRVEAFWLGLAGAALGLVPIILANRSADFGGYSRYTLASASGGVLILVVGIYFLSSLRLRAVVACLLVLSGVMTHHLNSARAVRQTESLRAFWWQAAWRIPGLMPGTTLVANYPDAPIEEDYFVWGPAALIYAPESTDSERLKPEFTAAVLTQYGLLKILSGGQPDFIDRRSIWTKVDYQNILILSRPTTGSCLHALDGGAPALSSNEENRMMLAAPFSKIDLIQTEATSPVPPEFIFGPEPAHDWCYYYEKADLARQRGDWDAVLELARTAKQQKLAAADAVEWLPFLEAYARAGDVDSVREVARQMKDDYVKFQACGHLHSVTALSDEVKILVEQAFCQ